MTDSERLRAERNATLSSCCGVTGETVLTDSAVILLFAGLLGAGDFLTLLSTAVLPLLNGLLIIPMAGIAPYCGSRQLVIFANLFALTGYLIVVASPFAGSLAVPCLLGGILLFAMCQTGFVAGWFPVLDTFLLPERRTLFLGRMRFFHQISAVLFLACVSFVQGEQPGIGLLQATLLAGALIFAGRILFILRIPDVPESEKEKVSLLKGLKISLGNGPLLRFSLYTFLLNLAMFGVIPFLLLHMKNEWRIPGNELVLISAAAVAGMPFGYILSSRLQDKLGKDGVFLFLHVLLIASLVILLLTPAGGLYCKIQATCCLLLTGFCIASNSVVAGAKMMLLARPGNKVMAMAFWGMCYYGGSGIARLGTSFLYGISTYCTIMVLYIILASGGLFFFLRSVREKKI